VRPNKPLKLTAARPQEGKLMAQRELGMTLITVLAVWLGLQTLFVVGATVSSWETGIVLRQEGSAYDRAALLLLAQSLGISLAIAALVNLAPALWLFRNRFRLADRWFSGSNNGAAEISAASLYVTGLLLLGIYFVVSGVQATAGNVFLLLTADEFLRFQHLASLGSSLVTLAAGLFLWWRGRVQLA
jgi:hypothetical protein